MQGMLPMKKCVIFAGLLLISNASLFAENTVVPDSAPATTTQTTTTAPTTAAPATPGTIDCNYHIPADTSTVDQNMVLQWAQQATQQSFDFDHTSIDNQMTALKACFTDQGWQSFQDALNKSGNLNAIKSLQLMVSSMVDGQGTITVNKDNQWKVTVPLQIVYQNQKQKLTQYLNVDLIVGRKTNGDLGIMQIIAAVRPSSNNAAPASTSTTTTTTTTAPAN